MICNFRRERVPVLRSSGVQVRVHMLFAQLRVPRTRQSPCYIGCVLTVIAVVVYQRLRSFQFTFIQAPFLLFLHQLKSTPRLIICLLLALSLFTDPTLLAEEKIFEMIFYFLQVEQESDQIDVVFSVVVAAFL